MNSGNTREFQVPEKGENAYQILRDKLFKYSHTIAACQEVSKLLISLGTR